jgi:hypothetical protein
MTPLNVTAGVAFGPSEMTGDQKNMFNMSNTKSYDYYLNNNISRLTNPQ